MKNTANTNKPAVTIGSTVCYRTKANSFNKAVVKDIVDSEFGKQVILTYNDKDGNPVEFQKLLKNVWVYTGRKAKADAEPAAEAEAPAAEEKPARPEVTVGSEVLYRTKAGGYNHATVKDIVDSEHGKVAVLLSKGKDGDIEFRKLLNNVFIRTKRDAKAATAAA